MWLKGTFQVLTGLSQMKNYLILFPVGNYGSSWHVAEGDISSAYRAFSNEKIFGRMGIYVGLKQVNHLCRLIAHKDVCTFIILSHNLSIHI